MTDDSEGERQNLFGGDETPDLFGTSTEETQEEECTSTEEFVTETLPAFDYGYFDALVAIGFASLADAYHKTPGSPRIERTPAGFQVSFVPEPLEPPDRGRFKYTVAGSWKEKDWYRDGWTLVKDTGFVSEKEAGARRSYEALISTEGAAVDTSESKTTSVEMEGGQTYDIPDPTQRLYGALNKYADPTWINLCVYACRHEHEALLDGSFEEEKITFNSAVLPQSSKGANSGNAYSIRNASLSKSTSRPLSRRTCLAVAGLLRVGAGDANTGFAVPVPRSMTVETLDRMGDDNRHRPMGGGFFFAFDNYLSCVKLLLTYADEGDLEEKEARNALDSVAGANFVELGNAPSPSGSWQLTVPNHDFDIRSVERLQTLLYRWKKASTPRRGGTPSVDRASVRQLVRGFEESDPLDAAEGYLKYVTSVGVERKENGQTRTYYRLDQSFFSEIMAHDSTYSDLLDAFEEEEVAEFVKLVRQDTHDAVYPRSEESGTPNYEMIRKLREVQGMDDFVQALAEISIERGVTKLATAGSEESEAEYHSRPFESSIQRLTELGEDYSPRLIAQLVLARALSRKPGESSDGE